jgi:hypothetical protein
MLVWTPSVQEDRQRTKRESVGKQGRYDERRISFFSRRMALHTVFSWEKWPEPPGGPVSWPNHKTSVPKAAGIQRDATTPPGAA